MGDGMAVEEAADLLIMVVTEDTMVAVEVVGVMPKKIK